MGEMEAKVAKLESDVDHLEGDVKEIKADVKTILAKMNQAEGGLKTVLWVSGAMGGFSGVIGAIAATAVKRGL